MKRWLIGNRNEPWLQMMIGMLFGVPLIVGVMACNPASNVSDSPSGSEIYYWHDDAHSASCWLYGGAGNYGKAISCLRP